MLTHTHLKSETFCKTFNFQLDQLCVNEQQDIEFRFNQWRYHLISKTAPSKGPQESGDRGAISPPDFCQSVMQHYSNQGRGQIMPQRQTEAEHNRPIRKFFGNRPLALCQSKFLVKYSPWSNNFKKSLKYVFILVIKLKVILA